VIGLEGGEDFLGVVDEVHDVGDVLAGMSAVQVGEGLLRNRRHAKQNVPHRRIVRAPEIRDYPLAVAIELLLKWLAPKEVRHKRGVNIFLGVRSATLNHQVPTLQQSLCGQTGC